MDADSVPPARVDAAAQHVRVRLAPDRAVSHAVLAPAELPVRNMPVVALAVPAPAAALAPQAPPVAVPHARPHRRPARNAARYNSIGFVMDSVGQWPALSPSEAFEIRNLLKLGHLADAQPRNGANG